MLTMGYKLINPGLGQGLGQGRDRGPKISLEEKPGLGQGEIFKLLF